MLCWVVILIDLSGSERQKFQLEKTALGIVNDLKTSFPQTSLVELQ